MQGSTPIDLAEPDMVKMLEELKKRQNDKPKINAVSLIHKDCMKEQNDSPKHITHL